MYAPLRARVRRLTLAFSLAAAFAAAALYPATAQAQAQSNCFQNYFSCLDRASQLATPWSRSAAGADCYVTLLGCIRRAVIGL